MSVLTVADLCNANDLYSEDPRAFNYFLPKGVLEGLLDGKAYDNKESYTALERKQLEEDIHAIYAKIERKKGETPSAVISAGAPGTGKTTLMHQVMRLRADGAAYVCPDDVCLKKMSSTYQAELTARLTHFASRSYDSDAAAKAAERDLRQEIYNKWRPGSNAATYLILGNLIREKYDFYFGTTATSPATAQFFQFLKKQGYRITLLHVSAPDKVRRESIQGRDKIFVQTTEHDIVEKGLLVVQRMQDTYLKFADRIEFFYRAGVNEEARLAAIWNRGGIQVLDPSRYSEIKKIHDAVCRQLNRPELSWERVVERPSGL